MNRKERRKYAKNINTPQKLETVTSRMVQARTSEIEKYYKQRELEFIDVMVVMTAYTINYKLGLGKKRLPSLMKSIIDNIDAFRTGHLSPKDFDTIKEEMKALNINI